MINEANMVQLVYQFLDVVAYGPDISSGQKKRKLESNQR